MYVHQGAVPSNSDWTLLGAGGGGRTLPFIEVSRTTNKTITGTPSGLAFNSIDAGFDAAVYTFVSGNNDVRVIGAGTYIIRGELTVNGTQFPESEFGFDWFLNLGAIPPFQRCTTLGSGFDDTPAFVGSTIIRTLSAADDIGCRISRTSGGGGVVDADTARLSLIKIA